MDFSLHRFGLHDTIIKTIQSLYDKPTAKIKINGYLSNSFNLERGSRQGCAWSPLLFTLYLKRLAQHIRQNEDIRGINIKGTEHKLDCYADDILIYLWQTTYSLPKLMQSLETYGQLSGYKTNVGKTSLVWQTESFKYLGINMSKDLVKLFEYGQTDKGLTVLCNIVKGDTIISFETLKEKYSLETQDFYRYLQMRHFVNMKMKNVAGTRKVIRELFRKAYNSDLSNYFMHI